MKKKQNWKFIIIGGLTGLLVGILPFFSVVITDNIFEKLFALPIIPLGLIFGSGGHPPLAVFLSPLIYVILGMAIGYIIGKVKYERI